MKNKKKYLVGVCNEIFNFYKKEENINPLSSKVNAKEFVKKYSGGKEKNPLLVTQK